MKTESPLPWPISVGVWFIEGRGGDRFTESYKEGIPIVDRIRMASKMRGVKAFEIHYPYEVTEDNFDEIRSVAKNEGLKILSVIPGLFNERRFKDGALISYDKKLRQEAIDRVKKAMQVNEILKEADVEIKKKTIIALLPKYSKLPPIAEFADQIARTYLTKGVDDTVRAIEKYRGGDTKIKSVAYAFLLAMDRGEGKKWQYIQTEFDFAHFLKEPADQLLTSEPGTYHDALQTLLNATGSTEKIKSD